MGQHAGPLATAAGAAVLGGTPDLYSYSRVDMGAAYLHARALTDAEIGALKARAQRWTRASGG